MRYNANITYGCHSMLAKSKKKWDFCLHKGVLSRDKTEGYVTTFFINTYDKLLQIVFS